MPHLRLASERLDPPRGRAAPRLYRAALRGLGRAAALLHRAPPLLPIHALGQRGEDLAYWCLREHGYTIVARNYRQHGRAGEIDLIAVEGQPPTLVFVEVKTRAAESEFAAERAVDAAKRSHLIRLARAYRWRRDQAGPYRFDVVVIYGPDDDQPRIKLHRGAFHG